MSVKDAESRITMEPAFLNKTETCEALGGCSIAYLDQEVRAGRINPQLCAGRVVFTPVEVRRYAAECPSWEPK